MGGEIRRVDESRNLGRSFESWVLIDDVCIKMCYKDEDCRSCWEAKTRGGILPRAGNLA